MLMGIDLGTSKVKVAITNKYNDFLSIGEEEYVFDVPKNGYAEQDPEVWWNATKKAMVKAINSIESPIKIKAIGFSGQMHGLVLLDKNFNVIRKAILHCDQRSIKQVETIKNLFDKEYLINTLHNPIFSGFQLTSLKWIQENEIENYSKIYKIISPKDYIRFKLCGEIGVEYTDASATLLFDVEKKEWSREIIETCGFDINFLPSKINCPSDIAGYIKPEIVTEFGMNRGTVVVYGGSDQSMQLLGSGVYKKGIMTITLGSGAQTVMLDDNPMLNPKLNTHLFLSANSSYWFSMGAVLNAGIAFSWLKRTFFENLSFEEMDNLANSIEPCSNNLVFFPCLAGERTPYLDSNTRGVFLGASYIHNKGDFIRATMEGIAFSIKESYDLLIERGYNPNKIIAAGGVVNSPLWLKILSDIIGKEIWINESKEQASLGACIEAAIGIGYYRNEEEACNHMIKAPAKVIKPNLINTAKYENFYNNIYKEIYKSNKTIFSKLSLDNFLI